MIKIKNNKRSSISYANDKCEIYFIKQPIRIKNKKDQ